MKKILLLGTGGTIACAGGQYGLSPQLTCTELLSYIPEAKKIGDIDVIQVINIDSTEIRAGHWLKLAAVIEENYDDYDGFVIAHGTDTLAYTAAALSYLIQQSAKAIVLTGAQKPIHVDSTDAKRNLLDSIRFAACDQAHGVSIVFNGRVITGTRGRKVRTKSFNAFQSINFPAIASVIDGKILFYLEGSLPATENVRFYHALNERVAVLKLTPGLSADILDYMAAHYDAIIIEGFGVGGFPSDGNCNFLQTVERLIRGGHIIIMASQVTEEGSDLSRYEVGCRIKKEYDLPETYDMTLEAAITKMMWILTQTSEPAKVRRMLYTPIQHDILEIPADDESENE